MPMTGKEMVAYYKKHGWKGKVHNLFLYIALKI